MTVKQLYAILENVPPDYLVQVLTDGEEDTAIRVDIQHFPDDGCGYLVIK